MSVNSYLQDLSSNLVLSQDEKDIITVSLDTLKKRLAYYSFPESIYEKIVFGSYTRETILPRKYDEKSDIDFLVVYSHIYGYKPQTYLNWLKNFVEYYYSSSEIYQSSPTIVLELQHIKFEITPGYSSYGSYLIPNGISEWQLTQIKTDDQALVNCNKENGYKIKPIIRLIKRWNVAKNRRRLASYFMEKIIANTFFYDCHSYTDYLLFALNRIKERTYANFDELDKVIQGIKEALNDEANGYPHFAELQIKKYFPEV